MNLNEWYMNEQDKAERMTKEIKIWVTKRIIGVIVFVEVMRYFIGKW